MTPEQYEKVREIFLDAKEKAPDERAVFLDEVCAGDAETRREVESLLASDERAGTFLRTPVLGSKFARQDPAELISDSKDTHFSGDELKLSDGAASRRVDRALPETIGRYRILGVLGEGGMGVVYRAEQDSPRRTVALKAIKPGIESRETLARFTHEGQVLGKLQHPGIAQVFEAGTTETKRGPQPFFAMELVDGVPLTEYAHKMRLDIAKRLRLMIKVCEAVHHAHQKGIIHRDLKPSNILVDATGQPKILDFGVARAIDADMRTVTLQTAVGQLVGTIAYMSPEQIEGDPNDLDTRSDVYALGVICYELLTGRVPIDLARKTLPQAARAVIEEEPASLSSVNRVFRGDIEAIVAKAMEKNRKERYQSASNMAEDIQRFLSDQPVSARQITTFYQLRKFARRNRTLVAVVVIAFVSLSAGLVYVTLERNRAVRAEKLAEQRREEAERQRAEADRQASIARAVNDFLNNDLLAAASPEEAGPDATVREVLDRAAWTIEGKFKDAPLTRAAIRDTLGMTYVNLGLYDQARTHFEAALTIGKKIQGEDAPDTLVTRGNLALLLKHEGRLEKAEQETRQVLEVSRRVQGEHHPETLRSMNNLAAVLSVMGRLEEAVELMEETVRIQRTASGESSPDTLTAMNNLGLFLTDNGRVEEGEPLLQKTWESECRVLGPSHPDTITTLANLSTAKVARGRLGEAIPLLEEVLELRRRVLGEEHPDTLAAMNNLASTLRDVEREGEARDLFRSALVILKKRLGNRHPHTLATMNNLAGILRRLKEFEEAEQLYRHCLTVFRETLGAKNPRTLGTMNNLAALLEDAERYDEAEPLYREALGTLRSVVGDRHPAVFAMMNNLGHLLNAQGRYQDAEVAFKELIGLAEGTLPEGHWHLGVYRGAYGECLMFQKRYEEAEPHLLAAYKCLKAALGEAHSRTRGYAEHLVALYTEWGKPDHAETWKPRRNKP